MGQTKIAIFGQSISKGLKVSKGDSVVLSEIKNGMALGFNQNTGSQGTVPIAIFEAPTVVVDFGTNAIRIGYFDNGFRPILNDQGQLNRTCRFAFDDGWKFKMISSNQSIKGLKTWIRTSSMQDFYFQLSGVTARFDGQMLFETGHTSIGIGELLELLFKEIKKDADAEYSRYKVNAASILVILPHRWTYYQKSLVKQAARSAGFYKVSVSCPSVALAYALEKPKLSSIMISIGAGFTEIALVNQQQVVDIAGKELGGNSFTRAIYTHVIRHNNLELGILESRQLFNECEVAKKALCFAEYADIPLFNGQVYRLEKRMLSSIFEVLLGELKALFVQLLERNHVSRCESVLGCGGSLQMPFLVQAIQEWLGAAKVGILPDDALIKGGARSTDLNSNEKFQDVTPYSFGFGTPDGLMEPILKSQAVPAMAEVHVVSNSSSMTSIALYEGEFKITRYNQLLKIIRIEPTQNLFPEIYKVRLSLDQCSTLQVSVFSREGELRQLVTANQPLEIQGVSSKIDPATLVYRYRIPDEPMIEWRALLAPLQAFSFTNQLVEYHNLWVKSLECIEHPLVTQLHETGKKIMMGRLNTHKTILTMLSNWQVSEISVPASPIAAGKRTLLLESFDVLVTNRFENIMLLKSISDLTNYRNQIYQINDSLEVMDVFVEDWNYLRAFLLKECSRHLKLLDCCDDLVHTNIARVEMRNFSSEYLEASVELLAMTEVEQSVPPFIHDWFHWHAKAHSVFFDKVTREQPPMKFQHADQVGGIPAFQQLYTLAHEIQTKISTDHARIFGIPIIMTNDKVEPQHNKDLFMYEEFLLKSQIKVDGIDIQGNDLLRLFRKDVVQMGEFRLQQIDALKNLYLQKL